jgi:hypothetical protein
MVDIFHIVSNSLCDHSGAVEIEIVFYVAESFQLFGFLFFFKTFLLPRKLSKLQRKFFLPQVMPILTTTYPLINSTFNVSPQTQKLIQEKMLVAAEICDRVMEGQENWDALFKVSFL